MIYNLIGLIFVALIAMLALKNVTTSVNDLMGVPESPSYLRTNINSRTSSEDYFKLGPFKGCRISNESN